MKSFITLVFPTLFALINCSPTGEMEAPLHPAIIANINNKIDEILKHFPLVFPPQSKRDIELYEKLVELQSAKLDEDATEREENEAFDAIFLFHDFLELRLELKVLLSEVLKEWNDLVENLDLNSKDSLKLSNVMKVFQKTAQQGSIADMFKVIQAYNNKRSEIHQAVEEAKGYKKGNGKDQQKEEGGISRSHFLRYSSYLRSHSKSLPEDKQIKAAAKEPEEETTEGKSLNEGSTENKELIDTDLQDKESNSNEEDSFNRESENDKESEGASSNQENEDDEEKEKELRTQQHQNNHLNQEGEKLANEPIYLRNDSEDTPTHPESEDAEPGHNGAKDVSAEDDKSKEAQFIDDLGNLDVEKLFKNSGTGKLYLSKNCFGVNKRFQLCNEKPCPSSVKDFRAEQCSAYDEVDFQGHQYKWEPYTKDDAECELNCKPVGMKYFATLNDSVIDGTPCEKPGEYYRANYRGRAMCIEGICKAVHASGLIAGLSANSGAVACGGLLCRPLTGLYTRDPLPEDAYIHVAMIPAGASNISITELKNSMNLLVLRTEDQKYVFNGDNAMSDSGTYEAAGAVFDYHRLDSLHQGEGVTEWVTCTGPVRESLELMIYSKTVNPGIKYEYLLPITSDSEENEVSVETDGFLKSANDEAALSVNRPARRRRYNWKVVGFSTCSKSCGGGIQSPVIKCVRENPLRYYSQRRCVHSEKPVINENLLRCNTQPCPAYWRTEEWAECRCHHPNDGIREREINCVQELASGIVVHVDETACMEEKPVAKKPCDCPKNKRRSNSKYRMHGISPNASHSPAKPNREKAGIWLMSDWNQYCSSECGPGVEYRTIFCDRTKSNPDRCDFRFTPETTRMCESEQSCEAGEWFAGPWSPCNGNCFNLTRTRQVLCIENQLILEEEDCKPEVKPAASEKCSHEEVEYCGPRWHYSEWTECTKTCDGGTQRRSVKCMEYNEQLNALKESNKCRYSIREPIYRSCNTHKCEDLRYEQIQNDETFVMPCTDAFTNCPWAVKAKLCTYEYYKQKCCYSCSETH